MSQIFEKYVEGKGGSSAASGTKTTSPTERYRKLLMVYTEQVKQQNGRLKKIIKSQPDKRPNRDENYQKMKEEKILKAFARQLKRQRKSLKKELSRSQDESITDNASAEASVVEKSGNKISADLAAGEKNILNEAAKQMRKQEKLLKRFLREKLNEKNSNKDITADNEYTYQGKNSEGKKATSIIQEERSFLHKLGDVFLKSLPNLLCIGVKFLFRHIFKWGKNLRLGIA